MRFMLVLQVLICLLIPSREVLADATFSEVLERHNNNILIEFSPMHFGYRELDINNRTFDGILNSESGDLNNVSLQGRWQGTIERVPVWMRASFSQTHGDTQYKGYLQRGVILTPYEAMTKNLMRRNSFSFGIPIGWENIQIIPFVEWSSHLWQRDMAQYQENYSQRSTGGGVKLQWAVSPQLVLETAVSNKRQYHAKVWVPQFGFSGEQVLSSEISINVNLAWYFHKSWYFQMGLTQTGWRNSASAVQNNLQAPPSKQTHEKINIGLGWTY